VIPPERDATAALYVRLTLDMERIRRRCVIT